MTAQQLKARAKVLWGRARLSPSRRRPPLHRRLVGDLVAQRSAYLQGADDYVDQIGDAGVGYLYCKPFDSGPGHDMFYLEMYQVLNILRAMALPARGRVIEVGSGPGWVTEILLMLGYEVDAVEPSEAMIRVAKERIAACHAHFRQPHTPRVRFHCQPFEECELPDDGFDGVVFHESLHHLFDEHQALAVALRKLRPGGVIGISGETAWTPGTRVQEEFFRQETARYGTLESPFTREYIDYLLAEHGFEQITRYHSINGLFPESQGRRTIAQAAQFPAAALNTITARKPGAKHTVATTANGGGTVLAEIRLIDQRFDASRCRVDVRVRLTNTGTAAWLHERRELGYVTIGMRRPPGAGGLEALTRTHLPRDVNPGDSIEVATTFQLPDSAPAGVWELDLINEMTCWFSVRGTRPAQIEWPGQA
ncbi:MAG TPA: class I SAM-dependent methyltransferase [Pirellulales bacterium]|nr:class I SAM-dependent methyltransferase [Pirellulales bacterium]